MTAKTQCRRDLMRTGTETRVMDFGRLRLLIAFLISWNSESAQKGSIVWQSEGAQSFRTSYIAFEEICCPGWRVVKAYSRCCCIVFKDPSSSLIGRTNLLFVYSGRAESAAYFTPRALREVVNEGLADLGTENDYVIVILAVSGVASSSSKFRSGPGDEPGSL